MRLYLGKSEKRAASELSERGAFTKILFARLLRAACVRIPPPDRPEERRMCYVLCAMCYVLANSHTKLPGAQVSEPPGKLQRRFV